MKGDYNCDVCVIGGGFSGLSTALEAARLGLSVILIEQNKIAWGASGRNGGQIWPDTSWGIEKIESQYGYNLARKIWDISLNGVSLIDERIKEFDINCDKKLGGILAATSSRKLKEFEEEKEYFSKNEYLWVKFLRELWVTFSDHQNREIKQKVSSEYHIQIK